MRAGAAKRVLLLALLGTAASAFAQTLRVVRTPEGTYLLRLRGDSYILQALRSQDQTTLWTAVVEPVANGLYLRGSVLLTSSCFSGAYLSCEMQAFSAQSGRELWRASGKLGTVGKNAALLWDDFFVRDDEVGSLYAKLHVLPLPGGTPRSYDLRVPPRAGCRGPVELLAVQDFSASALKTSLRDSCGEYVRTFR